MAGESGALELLLSDQDLQPSADNQPGARPTGVALSGGFWLRATSRLRPFFQGSPSWQLTKALAAHATCAPLRTAYDWQEIRRLKAFSALVLMLSGSGSGCRSPLCAQTLGRILDLGGSDGAQREAPYPSHQTQMEVCSERAVCSLATTAKSREIAGAQVWCC